MLKVSGVRIEKGGTLILNNVDIESSRTGEIIALLGPSGCGKTSLLRACAGLEAASAGAITLNGKLVSEVLASGKIGYVPQNPVLLPWLNAKENATLVSVCRDGAFDPKELQLLVGTAELTEDQLKRPARQLAGGQQQRIVLIRALLPRPQLLLLDEAFSSLDASLKWRLVPRLRKLLRERDQDHSATIMVSHDISDCLLMADRILIHNSVDQSFAQAHEVSLADERTSLTVDDGDFQREFLAVFKMACI